ncbi:AT-hook motif nuclear-localized protein 27-like [Vicia villosa]|uniref:AT-hook motif nuclear-localized protein 27-like n=1 Tax=Vicia villosa TaxID=3911 RepID=UPI00273BE948|nr:AT-hook motif nuclear-localized protein 27-like [Vicia villosa]
MPIGLTPHIIEIDAGVDLLSILFEFARSRGRSIRILSGTGVVADVTLQQPNRRFVSVLGMFDLLSIHGTIIPMSRMECLGVLQITLSDPWSDEDDVIRGSVISPLLAYSPMRVTVVSFSNDAF